MTDYTSKFELKFQQEVDRITRCQLKFTIRLWDGIFRCILVLGKKGEIITRSLGEAPSTSLRSVSVASPRSLVMINKRRHRREAPSKARET